MLFRLEVLREGYHEKTVRQYSLYYYRSPKEPKHPSGSRVLALIFASDRIIRDLVVFCVVQKAPAPIHVEVHNPSQCPQAAPNIEACI